MWRPSISRAKDQASPETVAGSPTYDARIDPAITAAEIDSSLRLATQRDLHLFGDKTAPALEFSHYVGTQPAPLTGRMMLLAAQRDQIERVTSRKDYQPYPGVELGHVPAFANSPNTDPVIGSPHHLTHHAHEVESKRASRRRFGH